MLARGDGHWNEDSSCACGEGSRVGNTLKVVPATH